MFDMIPFLRWPRHLRLTLRGSFNVLAIPFVPLYVIFRPLVCGGLKTNLIDCAVRSVFYEIAGMGGSLFFAMLCICAWWIAIEVSVDVGGKRCHEMQRGESSLEIEAVADTLRVPGLFSTFRYLSQLTIADLFGLILAIFLFALWVGVVLGVPNIIVIFVLSFFGVDRSILTAFVIGEAWLLTVYLFLFAYLSYSGIKF